MTVVRRRQASAPEALVATLRRLGAGARRVGPLLPVGRVADRLPASAVETLVAALRRRGAVRASDLGGAVAWRIRPLLPVGRASDRLQASALEALVAALRRVGPVRASDLGGAVARTVGPLLPVSRVADRNLQRALPALDRAARRRVVRGVWDNLGRVVGEFPHLGALRQGTASGPGWEMVGEEHLVAQAARGGPAIFVSGHVGNWEMLPPVVAAYGMVFSSMYRAPENCLVDALVGRLRREALAPYAAEAEVRLFPKGAQGARQALVHLARGGCLGLLVDQKMNDGIEARFFGRPAMTAPALAALALRFRCPVIPGHVERIGPARFRMVCEAPLPLPDSGDRDADIAALTQAVNDTLERWVRARPESWLWLHRRWPKD